MQLYPYLCCLILAQIVHEKPNLALQTHLYGLLYLLLNAAILKRQRVELEKRILPAFGLSLQSRLTFSPGTMQVMTMVCSTFVFREKSLQAPPRALSPALSFLQVTDSSDSSACPALPEPKCFVKSAQAALQHGPKVLELVGTGSGVSFI